VTSVGQHGTEFLDINGGVFEHVPKRTAVC
jgi:hypothetical protein